MVHCCIQKSPPLVPILSQINQVHALPISWRSILTFSHLCLRLPRGNLWSVSTVALAYAGSSHSKFKFYVNFLLLMSFQKIRISPTSKVLCLVLYHVKHLLGWDVGTLSNTKLEVHLLSTVQDALCNISSATPHIQETFSTI